MREQNQKKQRDFGRIPAFALALVLFCLLVSSCSRTEVQTDPGAWGYECEVTYDALGGIINQREVRRTFYLENSYVYRPAGSSGFLIQPIKDGHTLAGWYTAKEDVVDGSGNVVDYIFKAEDRWDFDEDRVQEDMTLYARWIPTATLNYLSSELIDGEHDLLFSKKITEDSGVQPLSYAVELSCTPSGHALLGYYSDPECTQAYDFNVYESVALIPDNAELYGILAEEFPDYFEEYDLSTQETSVDEDDEDSVQRNPFAYMEEAGYRLVTRDTTALAEIRARKDELINSYIERYLVVNADINVYLKFIEGRYVVVSGLDSLMREGRYYLDGMDSAGLRVDGYILRSDLDFTGVELEYTESFSGRIVGNGHKISNLDIVVNSRRRRPMDSMYYGGMFGQLDGAVIENVVFENILVAISEASGNSITVGLLAGSAVNTTVSGCVFNDTLIRTGVSEYVPVELSTQAGDAVPRLIVVGDLFGMGSGNTVQDTEFNDCTRNVGGTIRLVGSLF